MSLPAQARAEPRTARPLPRTHPTQPHQIWKCYFFDSFLRFV